MNYSLQFALTTREMSEFPLDPVQELTVELKSSNVNVYNTRGS